MTTRTPIGKITRHPNRKTFHAECLTCSWSINTLDLDNAHSLINSHHRIAHPEITLVYLEQSR